MTIFCNCGGLVLMDLCNTCGRSGQRVSYRSQCFCSSKSCTNRECDRKLTKKVQREAEGFKLPLAVADLSGTCVVYKC